MRTPLEHFRRALIIAGVLVSIASVSLAADVEFRLKTNDGSTKLTVQDSLSAEVFRVDSLGRIKLTPAPLNPFPVSGEVVVDNADGNMLKWHNGSSWQRVGTMDVDNLTIQYLSSLEVKDAGIKISKLDITGSPVAGQVLAYNSGTGQLVWQTASGLMPDDRTIGLSSGFGSLEVKAGGVGTAEIAVGTSINGGILSGESIRAKNDIWMKGSVFAKGAAPVSGGDASIYIGYGVATREPVEVFNLGVGWSALTNLNGGSNDTAIGAGALASVVTGDDNTAIGAGALIRALNNENIAVGKTAGEYTVNGAQNTFIGTNSGPLDAPSPDVSRSTAIGYNTKVTRDDTLILGDTDNTSLQVGIGTTEPASKLDVNGDIHISNTGTPSAGGAEKLYNVGSALFWNGTPVGVGGGTMMQVDTGTGLTGGPITTTGTISISPEGITSAEIAAGAVTDSKIAGITSPNKVSAEAVAAGIFGIGDFAFDGNVGIGTNEPTRKLEVMGTAKATTFEGDGRLLTNLPASAINAAGSNKQIQFNNAGTFGASSNLVWDNINSRLGIGTADPDVPFDVNGRISLKYDPEDTNALMIGGRNPGIQQTIERDSGGAAFHLSKFYARDTISDNTAIWGMIGVRGEFLGSHASPEVSYIYMGAGADAGQFNNALRLYPNNNASFHGFVSIGTAEPSENFVVYEANPGDGADIYSIINDGGTNYGLDMFAQKDGGVRYGALKTDHPDMDLILGAGSWGENIRLKPSGNVGIGTSEPTAKLDVDGSLQVKGNIDLMDKSAKWLKWPNETVVAPPSYGVRSIGTKIVLYDELVVPGRADYAIGVEGGAIWFSVPESIGNYKFKYYGGTKEVMSLTNYGTLETAGGIKVNGNIDMGDLSAKWLIWPHGTSYDPPTYGTRSVGTKIVLYDEVSAESTDYAIGVEGAVVWLSIPKPVDLYKFKFYGGNKEIMRLTGPGTLETAGGIAVGYPLGTLPAPNGLTVKGVSTFDANVRINGSLEVNSDKTWKSGGAASWTVGSDRRLKDIQGSYGLGLDRVMLINPVKFNYKKDNPVGIDSAQTFVGVIAQDLQKSVPEAVTTMPNGYLGVTTDPVFWAMLNSIKELKAENDSQQKQIDELKKAVEELKKK